MVWGTPKLICNAFRRCSRFRPSSSSSTHFGLRFSFARYSFDDFNLFLVSQVFFFTATELFLGNKRFSSVLSTSSYYIHYCLCITWFLPISLLHQLPFSLFTTLLALSYLFIISTIILYCYSQVFLTDNCLIFFIIIMSLLITSAWSTWLPMSEGDIHVIW